jgi:hypothetical protein
MKPFCRYLLLVVALFISSKALAQGHYTVMGIVLDDKGNPAKSATVFISGSEKITMTNDNGRFIFNKMDPGNFQLSVHMLGYYPNTKAITIKAASVDVSFSLKVKSNILSEVVIGGIDDWAKNYAIFKEQFLGTSANARNCVIINPRVLNFTTKKGTLTADADDFLVIENKRLGYRVKYLLKYFSYNSNFDRTGYDGDASFEEMDGAAEVQKRWAQNRLETYKGSMMHFLRAVYWNTVLKEGFLTYKLFRDTTRQTRLGEKVTVVGIDKRPVKFDTLVNVIDTSFVSFKFNNLYATYDPAGAAIIQAKQVLPMKKLFVLTDQGSTIKLYLKEAIIDRRGSYADYRTFLIKGDWSRRRIGDQLPFEYQPQ